MDQAMSLNGRTGDGASHDHLGLSEKAMSELRHEVRNLLNAIKLSCAVLHRRPHSDENVKESLRDIEQSADGINELISHFRPRHYKD